jgi:ribosomal-protein-alanine N-acetyltransferase
MTLSSRGLLIRDCKPSDFTDIQSIEDASFPEDPYPPFVFRSIYSGPGRIFRVATLQKKIIGYSIVKVEIAKSYEMNSHLVSLAVNPSARNRGIGCKLMQDAILRTKAEYPNCQTMALEVRTDNKEAVSLYKKFGFEERNKISNYYGDGKDALFMILRLEQKF